MNPDQIEAQFEHQLMVSDQIVGAVRDLCRVGEGQLNRHRIETRLSALNDDWQEFANNHKMLIADVAILPIDVRTQIRNDSYFSEGLFKKTREAFLEGFEKMSSLLDSVVTPSTSETQPTSFPLQSSSLANHHLPRLDLPKFDGKHTEWLTFKDMFSSLVINNNSLSQVEKLHYLRTSLFGPAALLLKHTAITGENFPKAWSDLISYYDNNRILVDSTLHSLFTIKPILKESAVSLEELYTTVHQNIRSLEMLGQPVQHWDSILIYLVTRCLDQPSIRAWELELGSSTDYPTWNQLSKFIINRMRSLQAIERTSASTTLPSTSTRQAKSHVVQNLTPSSPFPFKCPICESDHYISGCPEYRSKPPERKLELIKQNGLCYNCLGLHRSNSCPSARRCIRCGRKHHTSIHTVGDAIFSKPTFSKPAVSTSALPTPNFSTLPKNANSVPESSSEPSFKQVNHLSLSSSSQISVLLTTARAKLVLSHGERVEVRILIDQGSEVSLVAERLIQIHKLSRQKSYLSITGVGVYPSGKSKGSVRLELESNTDPHFSCSIIAEILPRLTSDVPSTKIHFPTWEHLQGIELADPHFSDPAPIDIILGSDVYCRIIQDGLRKGNNGDPVAQLTSFGWIISGPVDPNAQPKSGHSYHCRVEKDWYELIEKFWRQEEIVDTKTSLSPDEQQCEDFFKSHHMRTPSGQYIVRLPFKSPATTLGQSKHVANQMLHRLFTRFKSNNKFYDDYNTFLKEYEELGHMTQVSNDDLETFPVYYLPHHGVPHHSGVINKLRVVFNGSSKSSNGTSLNDILHPGAKLQVELFDVLLWFRKFRYVFSTDIEKMYRQIMIHPDDRCFQRILWKDILGNTVAYNLNTVTYGLVCAPFLALRTLKQLIDDEGSRFPLAIPVLTKGRYIDDIFGGGDSIDEAQEIVQEVKKLCLAGAMPLKKWISNNPAILDDIPVDHRLPVDSMTIDQTVSVSALGLAWQPFEDKFHFSLGSISESIPSKRSISSRIARMYDPLGFLSPVTLNAKSILQELWTLGIGWDDLVPQHIALKWNRFLDQLHDIRTISIPRWIGINKAANLQIHGFSDASQVGIAAVVYLKSSVGDHITTSLICSKTKVSPLKRITMPRLELLAATLLTRLTIRVVHALDLNDIPIHLWTDSSIVHTWINNHPSKWKEYVHNRVCLIQETIPQAHWRLVPGHENPADCASRGLTPLELSDHSLWWTGPSWLLQDSALWPCPASQLTLDDETETRTKLTTHVRRTSEDVTWDLIKRYSKLSRLLRITVMCQRVIKKFCHRFDGSILEPLTPEELEEAKYFWVSQSQSATFKPEMETLAASNQLPPQHPLNRLTPFLDSLGVLRLGGRLQNSLLSYDNKHPFILSRHCSLSNLIISDAHERTFHGSTQTTLSFIRATCWILGGRAPVRSFILKCMKCASLRKKNAQQLMGQLPFTRVTPVLRPFVNSGIDYAGPFNLKTWSGRAAKQYKAYIVLFVCQATSAIHLELVTDYTAEAFLAAYRRFTSRRGVCQTLSSDCGTNLKGADAELKRLFCRTSTELGRLSNLIANDGTKWLFNPPAAPHFGGKWEAGVKSVKYHLRRTIADTLVTYEEMTTLLTQIESVLNSRPLCPLTDDPNDISALTPGHFLIGQPLNVIPEPNLQEISMNRLSRWQRLRFMMEIFWTKWSREYLQRFQSIYKWNQPLESITIGQLVLIMDERYPPSKWPLGRVTQVHPGRDGLVRVATIKTQNTSITRPIVKLCPLPISTDTV